MAVLSAMHPRRPLSRPRALLLAAAALVQTLAPTISFAALDADTLLKSLAHPAPATTPFVEVRYSKLLEQPIVVKGQLEYLEEGVLVRSVDTPFKERTEIRGETVNVQREGKSPRRFSLKRAPELRSMLGGFAVGKTSLVRRFVESLFSDTYQTTVGVKVDKKMVEVHGVTVTIVLWDIQGVEEAEPLRRSNLRGTHGYLVVCDGTRGETLAQCLELAEKARATVGEVPALLLVNKADLKDRWEIPLEVLDGLRGKGWQILETSAKDGQNVEEAFQQLASSMVNLTKR